MTWYVSSNIETPQVKAQALLMTQFLGTNQEANAGRFLDDARNFSQADFNGVVGFKDMLGNTPTKRGNAEIQTQPARLVHESRNALLEQGIPLFHKVCNSAQSGGGGRYEEKEEGRSRERERE